MTRTAGVIAVLALFLASILALAIVVAYVSASAAIVSSTRALTPTGTALVLGAAVQPDKRPSPILRDRVEVAVELVKAGRVQHLLLSGASRPHYNEVAAMRRTALELGVSADLLSDDENGAHTYQSCLNAKKVFGLDEVVVVTQRFHLPRAIYLCQSVGLKTQGVPADRTPDQESVRHALREAGAWVLAIVNTHL